MDKEFNKPNFERHEPWSEKEDLLREVIPGQTGEQSTAEQGQAPIQPFELPKTPDAAGSEYHEEIPGQPLKAKLLTEEEKIREVNKMLSGNFEDPSDVTEFLSDQMES